MSRILRYLRFVRDARRHGIPLNRWNLRALWRQSDPDWLTKQRLDLSDGEAAAFLAAMGDDDA